MVGWLCLLLFGVYWLMRWNQLNKLPSPKYYVPFFGHIELLLLGNTNSVVHLWNLYKKYSRGGVMLVNIFGINNVFVGDYDTLKFLFNHPSVQNRQMHPDPKKCKMTVKIKTERNEDGPNRGLLFSQGRVWTEQRRFTLRTLRDFGFGKSSMDDLIQDEVKQLVLYLREVAQGPIDVSGLFNLPIINALWRITTGESFEYTDPQLVDLMHKMTEVFRLAGSPEKIFIFQYPWLFKLFPSLMQRDLMISVNQNVKVMIEKIVQDHQDTFDPNEHRDFIDAYLGEVQNTTDPQSSFHGDEGIKSLTNTMLDLFLAGSETTSTSLTWAFLYMAREPQIQQKVQAELDAVVGTSRLPCSADRPNLPYTEAVILEVMRCGNVVTKGVAHTSSEPITVNGIRIPANTLISPLMCSILHGDHWTGGKTFDPTRFLNGSGAVTTDPHLIPFSIGKRQCLGETLAKAEMFLFFAGLLQQFSIRPEDDGVQPCDDGRDGVTQLPAPFKVVLEQRL